MINNYEESDKILVIIEEVFLSLATKHKLKQVSIERWRWDQPVITLTWLGEDDYYRNFHALISPEASSAYKVMLEVNAWQDKDREEGKIRVRHWKHEKIGRVSPIRELIEHKVQQGYDKSLKLSNTEIKETYLIPKTTGP